MPNSAIALATQALISSQNVGIPLTDPLVDKTSLGSFWVRVGVTIGTGDTNVVIQLPRKPSCYFVVRRSAAVEVYDGSAPGTWSGALITLRASASVVVSLLVG